MPAGIVSESVIEALMRDESAGETIRVRTFCASRTHAVRICKMEKARALCSAESRPGASGKEKFFEEADAADASAPLAPWLIGWSRHPGGEPVIASAHVRMGKYERGHQDAARHDKAEQRADPCGVPMLPVTSLRSEQVHMKVPGLVARCQETVMHNLRRSPPARFLMFNRSG
jgi:hypothetical protein